MEQPKTYAPGRMNGDHGDFGRTGAHRARKRTAMPPAGAMSMSSESFEVTVRLSIFNSVGAVR